MKLILCLTLLVGAHAIGPVANDLKPSMPKCADCIHNDIIFMLEQSTLIMNAGESGSTWKEMKQFIVNVLNVSTANPDEQRVVYSKHFEQYEGVHVGFVIYNETAVTTGLYDFITGESPDAARRQVFRWLDTLPIYGGESNICAALKAARDEFNKNGQQPQPCNNNCLTSPNGVPAFPKTLVLLSSGEVYTNDENCPSSYATYLANTMLNNSVQILSVAVKPMDGSPNPQANYDLLRSISSKDHDGTPLVYDLKNATELNIIRNTFTSRWGCCECYGDIAVMTEVSPSSSGEQSHFHNLMSGLAYFANMTGIGPRSGSNSMMALTTYGQIASYRACPCGASYCQVYDANATASQSAANLKAYLIDRCPTAFNSSSSVCNFSDGHNGALYTGLKYMNNAFSLFQNQSMCDRAGAPNVGIVIASGQCDSPPYFCDPSQTIPNNTMTNYVQYFPLRYVIGIGSGGRCNFTALEPFWKGATDNCQVCGGVMNVLNNNDTSYNTSNAALPASIAQLVTTIKGAFSKQPGCKSTN